VVTTATVVVVWASVDEVVETLVVGRGSVVVVGRTLVPVGEVTGGVVTTVVAVEREENGPGSEQPASTPASIRPTMAKAIRAGRNSLRAGLETRLMRGFYQRTSCRT
jgi:hypothetical protein